MRSLSKSSQLHSGVKGRVVVVEAQLNGCWLSQLLIHYTDMCDCHREVVFVDWCYINPSPCNQTLFIPPHHLSVVVESYLLRFIPQICNYHNSSTSIRQPDFYQRYKKAPHTENNTYC